MADKDRRSRMATSTANAHPAKGGAGLGYVDAVYEEPIGTVVQGVQVVPAPVCSVVMASHQIMPTAEDFPILGATVQPAPVQWGPPDGVVAAYVAPPHATAVLAGTTQVASSRISSDVSSRSDSASCLLPRNSVMHCSFGSPIAAENPFPNAPVPASTLAGAIGAPLPRPSFDSASPVSPRSMQSLRGSLTAQTIIESTQALEAELQTLRQLQHEKDREIAMLRATIALTNLAGTAASGQTVEDPAACLAMNGLADATGQAEAVTTDTYSILLPAFGHLRRAYARSCNLPIIGGVARAGLWTADVCVSHATKWGSCEQVGKDVDGLLQHVDERVLTPHLHAARNSSLAFCEPALRKVDPLLVRSSALLAGLFSAPRGFAEAFGRRATMPVVWLREALRGWLGTPPGRLAREDRLSRSAEAARVKAASVKAGGGDATGGTGGVVARVGREDQDAEVSHD